jgi:hypothetical protein
MKISMLFIFTFLLIGATYSQPMSSDTLNRGKFISYYFNIQTGALIGCGDCKIGKEVTFSTSTIHGIRVGKKLRVGAGLGFDSYPNWQTLPLFGSVSWDLAGKKNVIFTQLNYGWARAWKPFSEQEYGFKDANGGQTFSAMIGYRIRSGDIQVAVLAGYKFQLATAYYTYDYYSWPSSFSNNETATLQTIKENMNRLAISLSVGWK